MDVIVPVKIPDYVYEFYRRAAQEIGNITTEEVLSRALFQYAGLVAEDLLYQDQSASANL